MLLLSVRRSSRQEALLTRECGSYSDPMGGPVTELDLRGLKCPLPVLRARRALRELAEGETIALVCTDPLAAIDIPHLARSEGHRLQARSGSDGATTFLITKGKSA